MDLEQGRIYEMPDGTRVQAWQVPASDTVPDGTWVLIDLETTQPLLSFAHGKLSAYVDEHQTTEGVRYESMPTALSLDDLRPM